ncbi:MAG: response regulator transcription factor [Lachnospiraceae bacterium]|jgi:two-component system response regulator protein BraR/BceR|nr:response regulator transcription factor [Lachnospiraceae bacterium]
MQKVMIVEDDPVIREELTLLLKNEGYFPLAVTDFTTIKEQATKLKPDLILLDINLPGQDGFSVCASLQMSGGAPIIFVTSRDTALDEIKALNLGADDYITKPYTIPVLLARMKAVLRRSKKKTQTSDILEAKGLTLYLTKGMVSSATKSTVLTRNELQILACLMEHAGEIVSRADLIETLWDRQIYIDDNTLSVNVTRLRTKLADLDLPDLIKTRRGMGYQL